MFGNWLTIVGQNDQAAIQQRTFQLFFADVFQYILLLHKIQLKTLFFSVQTFLRQILNGTKSSERHLIYTSGRVSEKDNLKHRAGFGPIADDKLVCRENDILFTDLLFSLSRSSSVRRKIKTVRISSLKLSLLSGHLYQAFAVTFSEVPTSYFLSSSLLNSRHFVKIYHNSAIDTHALCVAFLLLVF